MDVNESMARTRRILGAAVVLAVLLDVAAWALYIHHRVAHPAVPRYGYMIEGLYSGPLLVLLSVLLVRRRPQHRITWLLVAITFAGSIQRFTGAYAHESLAHTGSLAGAEAGLMLSSIAQFSFVIATVTLFHLFPTGATISRRWRAVVWSIPPLLVVEALSLLASARPFHDDPTWVHVRGPLADVGPGWGLGALELLSGLLVVPLLGSVVHLVLRFRTSRGIERQQLRWFVTGSLVAFGLIAVPMPVEMPGWWNPWAFGPAMVWASVGVAILRYRLYELDRIISRTLAYAVVSALLIGVYGIGVLGVGALLPGDRSDLLIAVSTLAVAALFRPITVRVQHVVDRRFNRARYDAARTVEAFGARLRDEVDLGSLSVELRDAVATTVQPRSISVWLRQGAS